MPATQPAYQRENVLVGQARMFAQKLVTGSAPALPADTVALNAAWPSSGTNIWVPVGATEEGLTFRFARSTEDITIEEQLTPVAKNTTAIDLAAQVVLSEDTLETMALAYGGGVVTSTAGGAGLPDKKVLVIGSDLDQYAFGFEGVNEFGFPRRVMIPLVVSNGEVETTYRRAAQARRYATAFSALCAPEEIDIVDIASAPIT